ncbi:hypothetical protein [Streptomyces colonosanans]|uniref:Lipoprotein n=1 Tax=Streptomyces colonosanans TaxID=1428652 RepID=A0A1S2Q084_9ACTN|nr:hypothetical protein [Streptomyces colonosanans]OIJ99156.1 hypothetical protein BIV24_05125 [Streptomyces colonosanans]
MRSSTVRRAALAASAAALALLATACGGSSDDDGKGGDGKTAQADKAASAAPAKVLSATELEKAALTQADVKSGKILTKVPAQDDTAQDKVKADDGTCAPLAYLQAASYVGKPAATVKRVWLGDAEKPAAGATDDEKFLAGLDKEKSVETLASYADGGAERAMKDLKAAAQKCADGFSYTAAGEKAKFAKVVTTQEPGGADEALALTLTVVGDGGVKAPVKTVVVRKGATIAYFPAINLASFGTGKEFEFPTQIVDAQLAKLTKLG